MRESLGPTETGLPYKRGSLHWAGSAGQFRSLGDARQRLRRSWFSSGVFFPPLSVVSLCPSKPSWNHLLRESALDLAGPMSPGKRTPSPASARPPSPCSVLMPSMCLCNARCFPVPGVLVWCSAHGKDRAYEYSTERIFRTCGASSLPSVLNKIRRNARKHPSNVLTGVTGPNWISCSFLLGIREVELVNSIKFMPG